MASINFQDGQGNIPAAWLNPVDGLVYDVFSGAQTKLDARTALEVYSTAQVDALIAGKADVGHTHVEADITDLDKYTQAAVDALLALKAPLDSPALTGTPTTTLAPPSTNNSQIASTEFVQTELTGKANVSHTHVEADITDLDKYTQAEVDAALALKAPLNSPALTGTPTAPTPTPTDSSTKIATTAFVRSVAGLGRDETPIFDVPLVSSLNLTRGVGSLTFTRSTTGTYIDRYGVLKTAAINTPRFERHGLLIEGASTNSLLQSDDATVATWTKTNCTVTTDTTLNPDGVTNSQKVTLSSAALGYIRQTLTITANTSSWSLQIKVKEGNADECSISGTVGTTPFLVSYSFLDEVINSQTGNYVSFELLPDGWVLLNVTVQNNNNTTLTFDFNPDISNTNGGFSYFCNAQAENIGVCSSYIPTTTVAVSRGADVLSAVLADNHPSLKFPDVDNPEGFSVIADTRFLGGLLATNRVIIDAGSEAAKARYGVLRVDASTINVGYYRSTVPVYNTTILNYDRDYRFGVAVNSSEDTVDAYVDGIQNAISTRIIDTESVTHQTNIGIGCNATGTEQMFGHISNIKIYNRQLNATQMSVV